MQLTKLTWLGGLLGLAQGYVYGTGTGTSPPTLSTGVSGTDPASSVPSSSAPYGNSTSSYYYPSGTAPSSTGTSADPTSYGTGDPSTKPTSVSGTAGSTGIVDPSGTGKLTYTAPTGIPTEYYYHHKKPKRDTPFFRRYGF